MRQFEPFDPNHVRCIHPVFGKHFDTVMQASGLDAVTIAKRAAISKEVVRGYRRGFYKPIPSTLVKLEEVFGVALTPPETVRAAPMTPVAMSLPDYFKLESAKTEDATGDMIVVYRIPKTKVMDLIGGLTVSITA